MGCVGPACVRTGLCHAREDRDGSYHPLFSQSCPSSVGIVFVLVVFLGGTRQVRP